jgi:hypothetical protein
MLDFARNAIIVHKVSIKSIDLPWRPNLGYTPDGENYPNSLISMEERKKKPLNNLLQRFSRLPPR